ncbi:MAG: biopolymer transporter ExbD [Phycisphaerae bacterium]|nr:biopolymer transporter ExbD [Phycisphaerae bacterium]
MAKKKQKVGAGQIDVNMTPMIDCTFQLIIFFILTAQMAAQEIAPVAVPEPFESMAVNEVEGGGKLNEMTNKVTVNVVGPYGDDLKDRKPVDSGDATYYQISDKKIDIGDVDKLTSVMEQHLALFKQNEQKKGRTPDSKKFFVEIRADQDVDYASVAPVMQAAGNAGISKMNITAVIDAKMTIIK